jgi:MYXO-CTERM domain-containing protein
VTDNVTLQVKNLPFAKPNVEIERVGVDRNHNNAFRVWDAAGRPVAPSEQLWLQMKTAGALTAIDAKQTKPLENGGLSLSFDQLQPGVSLLTITEEGADPNAMPPMGGSGGGGAGGASSGGGASAGSAGAGTASAGAPPVAGAGGIASSGAGGSAPTTAGVTSSSGGSAFAGSAPTTTAGQSHAVTPVATPSECGCRVPGGSRSWSAAATLLALALGWRRRQHHQSSRSMGSRASE